MKIPELKIGNLTANIPIIQGGMGVGISLHNLASAVANCGGIGIISGVQIGFREPDFLTNTLAANLRALKREIQLAKQKAKKGIIGVNFMVAMNNYEALVKEAVDSNIDLIISGAGLPLTLPELTKGSNTKIAPIVSSGKAASLICKMWDRKSSTSPDLIVVEGPLAGGHLGFPIDELQNKKSQELKDIVLDVKKAIYPFAKKYNKHIPVVAAGGIYNGSDIARLLSIGADGVQMGTRFITTNECDAHINYKLYHLNSNKEDIDLMISPVGMPGRAIYNDLLKSPPGNKKCLYKCLSKCKPFEIPYCISKALFNSANGDIKNGLVFCGSNGYKSKEIISTKDLIDELLADIKLYKS